MQDIVFRLALAVILASAVFFLISTVFWDLEESTARTTNNTELARVATLNKSIQILQQ